MKIKKIKIFFFGITTLTIIGIVIVGLFSLATAEVYKCRNLKTNLLFIYREEQKMIRAHDATQPIYVEKTKYIKMPGAYLWNFECIDGVYGKDDNAIYYLGVSISGADYETFETIKGSRFAKDKNNVYCFGNIVEGADAKTFIYSGEISDHSLLFGRENYGSQGHDKNKYKTYTCEDDTKF